jgi:hypothetical protein
MAEQKRTSRCSTEYILRDDGLGGNTPIGRYFQVAGQVAVIRLLGRLGKPAASADVTHDAGQRFLSRVACVVLWYGYCKQ